MSMAMTMTIGMESKGQRGVAVAVSFEKQLLGLYQCIILIHASLEFLFLLLVFVQCSIEIACFLVFFVIVLCNVKLVETGWSGAAVVGVREGKVGFRDAQVKVLVDNRS